MIISVPVCFKKSFVQHQELYYAHPERLKYTETDEWIKIDGQVATIGVTDFAQDALSDVVFFETVVSVGDDISPKTQISTIRICQSRR